MTRVVLVRPGCTDFDDQNRVQGALDLPLNRRGRDQVQDMTFGLRNVPVEVIYTSPCDPARSTAEAIGKRLGVPVKQRDELRNIDQGLWQGLLLEEIRRKSPRVFKQWQDSPETIRPPQGETVAEAVQRIRKVLLKPLKRKSSIVVVASEPLATLVCCVLQEKKPEFPGLVCGGRADSMVEVIETPGTCAAVK